MDNYLDQDLDFHSHMALEVVAHQLPVADIDPAWDLDCYPLVHSVVVLVDLTLADKSQALAYVVE